ncbi:MAG: bifunctional YncE family protein/alkaline phosphatase family protein [Gemmataceae bacterium]
MSRGSLLVVLLLLGGVAAFALGRAEVDEPRAVTTSTKRELPGMQDSGAVLLPNQWSLRPVGKHLLLGDFPVNLALHPSGEWLAALHAGYGEHEVVLIDLKRQKIVSRVAFPQTFYGLTFSPDGKTLFVSGAEYGTVLVHDFADGLLSKPRAITLDKINERLVTGGLTIDPAGKNLYVCCTWGDAVFRVPLDGGKQQSVELPMDAHPYACVLDPAGKRLFVSQWSVGGVAVIDLEKNKISETWPTERHPTEMVLSPDGKTLFVACANSTQVSVIDTATGKGLETIASALYPQAPNGNTPNSLCLTPDGSMLVIANADANNLAVFNVAERGKSRPMGFIPVGWYPTSVRFNPHDKRLYVANGKGIQTKSNRHGPHPLRQQTLREYIGGLFQGTLAIIDLPGPERMAAYSKTAYTCSPLRRDFGVTLERPENNPIPGKIGDASPIKHCIYIIKENRTYDQVLGDMKEGNGDPSLCLFDEKITPNHHKIAREFVLLDNFYVEGEVSADGHEWSMGAYCTDYVEKVWPQGYRGSPFKKLGFYPSEGSKDRSARPAGGYIWDRCAAANVTYRSYGEWIANGKTPADPSKARVKALEGHFDPMFRGYDLDYPDVKRAERFITELKRFEKEGALPQFTVLRLPNDHTYGTRAGKPTPIAMVADNDQALGMVVEAVSKSKFWKDTAIFVVEDDAQNGPDHVDAHRTIAFVISPYTKRKYVDSTMYSTSSMLRSMELILGLEPMSQFDAAARPMYHAFQPKPDLTPYQHVVPKVDMNEKNEKGAWGQKLSEEFDLSREDAADDLLFNEVIWRSVRGASSPMPPPVRAAFVFPHLGKDDDDDDD